MDEITRILEAVENGEENAAAELLPAAYRELRSLAASKMGRERAGHTLQPTALVHEAYLRLSGPDGLSSKWDCRAHFFKAAAEAMRRILIESARRKDSQKRGGDFQRMTWNEEDIVFETSETSGEVIAVDEALAKLEKENPAAAEVVKLRYFAGLSVDETASILETSPSTVDRTWRMSRAWLRVEIGKEMPDL
ncbi:sigma-70 family RNA polymerase sigma factor [Verrucomicrobiaceae bacterium 227]